MSKESELKIQIQALTILLSSIWKKHHRQELSQKYYKWYKQRMQNHPRFLPHVGKKIASMITDARMKPEDIQSLCQMQNDEFKVLPPPQNGYSRTKMMSTIYKSVALILLSLYKDDTK